MDLTGKSIVILFEHFVFLLHFPEWFLLLSWNSHSLSVCVWCVCVCVCVHEVMWKQVVYGLCTPGSANIQL